MKIEATIAEDIIAAELGRRAQQQRVGMNLTQTQLAAASGVSARTIERFEAGASIQLDKLIRILRALRLSDNLDQLIPSTAVRPLQLVGKKSTVRRRAHTGKRTNKPGQSGWVWGDRK